MPQLNTFGIIMALAGTLIGVAGAIGLIMADINNSHSLTDTSVGIACSGSALCVFGVCCLVISAINKENQ